MAEHAVAVRNAINDARVDQIDVGTGTAKLVFRTGAAPAIGSASSGTVLVEFDLANPAFGASSNGAATASAVPASTGEAAGTVGHYEVLNRNGVVLWRENYATGSLTLNTTTISVGVEVTVSGWTSTTPAGAA